MYLEFISIYWEGTNELCGTFNNWSNVASNVFFISFTNLKFVVFYFWTNFPAPLQPPSRVFGLHNDHVSLAYITTTCFWPTARPRFSGLYHDHVFLAYITTTCFWSIARPGFSGLYHDHVFLAWSTCLILVIFRQLFNDIW